MADLTAQRTLVKSPPELWSELSEVESLARHLGELGEIRIVKVEPESTVAWEGEEVSGTVELEQSGWGTKVTFRATVPEPGPAAVPEAVAPEPEPVAAAEPVLEPEPEAVAPEAVVPEPVAVEIAPLAETQEKQPQGFFARWLFRRRQPLPPPEPEPAVATPEPEAVVAEPEPVASQPEVVVATPDPKPVAAEPAAAADPEPEPGPTPQVDPAAERVQQVLDGTLEALGQAHHRPFSRG